MYFEYNTLRRLVSKYWCWERPFPIYWYTLYIEYRNVKLKDYDFVIPVYNNNNPLAYVLIGDIDDEMAGVSPVIKHLHFIQTISNVIIVAIENIRLFKESLKQESLRKELELASRMQSMLIPKKSVLPGMKKY